MLRTTSLTLGILAMALMVGSPVWAGTTIFSDGFNFTGTPPSSFTTVYNGGTIGPWTVGGDSVDWIGGYWQPAEGNGSLDLSGNAAGGVFTTLNTVAGQEYLLTFYLAGNTDGGNTTKIVNVQINGYFQLFAFDSTGFNRSNMGWTLESLTFTASGNDVLGFWSMEQNAYGPALDGVTVETVVPEPSALVYLGCGTLAAAGMLRRKLGL